MLLGLIAVAIFSLTLPFTRLAVGGGDAGAGLSPTFVALGRALVAAVLAAGW
ncbi:EamA family transporter, partial [Rugamonas sp. FT81W]|nr:EamA family transporter [Duganella vulcania]